MNLLGEFADRQALLAAARAARDAGYTRWSAYAPHAIDGLAELAGAPRPRIGLAMLAGAVLGGGGTYLLQWYASVIAYPLDVGGRPAASWPLFVPAAAEMTLLFAALAGVAAFLVACRLPRLHDPLWDVAAFAAASGTRYFLALHDDDPQFEPRAARGFLAAQSVLAVHEFAT